MEIVEYEDVIAFRYTEIPERVIDAQRRDFDLTLAGINGHETEITLVTRRRRDGALKVAEAHLGKDTPDKEIEDLSSLHWFILPGGHRGKKLPPVLTYWEIGGHLVVACLPWGNDEWQPFADQIGSLDDETTEPDADRMLCWWPDMATWNGMKQVKNIGKWHPVTEHCINFFAYQEFFARPDMCDTPPEKRAYEYARYVRRLRTMLLWYRKNGIAPSLKLGNTRGGLDEIEKRNLNPLKSVSWSEVSYCFDKMPDVYIEEVKPCGPIGIVGKDMRASLGYVSHIPKLAPTLDCVTVALYSGANQITNLTAWVNPLTENVFGKATDAVMEAITSYGAREVAGIDGVLPSESCECGAMTCRVPDEWLTRLTVFRGEKVGRNDPCPCGSGKKYKRCCGR